MIYTVRFAHLAEKPSLAVGQKLNPGDTIGIMGSTGKSTGDHLHIDCVEYLHTKRYTLADMENGKPKPSPRQLNYFIDSGLFGIDPVITTYYADPEYQTQFKKIHCGYDVVPKNRRETKANYAIKWNRSKPGRVELIVDEPHGYGHCVYISFEF